MQGQCPEADDMAKGELLKMVDLIKGDEIDLVSISTIMPGYESAQTLYSELDFGASIIGSVGPYLFIHYSTESTACTPADTTQSSGFVVFDVDKAQQVQILSSEERSRILETEQVQAYEKIRGDHIVEVKKPEDLAGHLIRSGRTSLAFCKALGIKPVTMPISDVYSGLDRGIIEGYMLGPSSTEENCESRSSGYSISFRRRDSISMSRMGSSSS